MADFRLGRLKFNWRGAWAASTAYVIDDIVSFKGNTYVCVANHTSAASETSWANTDLNIATPRWQLHVPGTRMMGEWSPNTFYAVNDLVSYGAVQYLCTADHTAAANENLFYSSDLSNWDVYTTSTTFKSDWQAGTWYKENDIVKYGNTLYLTTQYHTSGISFDATKFSVYLESFNFENSWSNSEEYQPGDVVNFGGYTYIAETINTGKQPNLYNQPDNTQTPAIPADWSILTTGFTVKGEYDPTTIYVPGDVVQFGGNTFVKTATGAAGVDPDVTSAWDLVARGLNFRGPWNNGNTYEINDVVSVGTSSFVALQSSINIDPIVDNQGAGSNWAALAQGESTLNLINPGDILYRNNTNTNVNLPIGSEGEILTVDAAGLPGWERNNTAANVYYVATDGTDDPAWGKNLSKPWRSLRYALTQTANSGTASNLVTIFVKSGTYNEQLPLTVTPYTSICGDNLRATVIGPDTSTQSTDTFPVANRHSTMFLLSESVTLKDLVFVGMEGFEPALGGDDWDITQAQYKGVFLRLDPNLGGITGKSPYITQCSAFSGRPESADEFSNGGIGALIDKSVYGSTVSNGSMLFDSFTQFHDGGVGFWCKDLGNAEIVSSFTYYCHIGYTCTGGGRIRSLSGNNSYGVYGAVSSGTDSNETLLEGEVRGSRLDFAYAENSVKFKKFEQVVQGTAGVIQTGGFTPVGTDLVGEASADYGTLATTSTGNGTGATFAVTRDGSGVLSLTMVGTGEGYAVSDVLVILGSAVGGVDATDDISITIDNVANDFTASNPNYALALILYTQESTEDEDGATAGEDYLLIESITGTFTNSKPVNGVSSSTIAGSGAVAITKDTDALGGIYGKIFTVTGLPVDNTNPNDPQAVLPERTGATKFKNVVGNTNYDDPSYYVIQDVTDASTAQTLSITTLRQYDVPGAEPTSVEITSFTSVNQGSDENLITVVCASSHGLSTGDDVVVAINNLLYNQYATPAFERSDITIDPSDGTKFTYVIDGGHLTEYSNAVTIAGSRVYAQTTTGGDTKELHSGGTNVDLYNLGNTPGRLEILGTGVLSNSATSIALSDPSIASSYKADPNDGANTTPQAGVFVLLNNEIMEVSAIDVSVGLTVTRGKEGTAAAAHAEGSRVYFMTKTAASTTLRVDVDTATNDLQVFSIANMDANDIVQVGADSNGENGEFFRVTSVNSLNVGQATITFARPKSIEASSGQEFDIRLKYSQVRLTGHDFLLIGTGGKASTGWPDVNQANASQVNEVFEDFPGRVYYVSTDQDGNFRVGEFFTVEQATGKATLDANSFDLSGLSSLRLGSIGAQLGAAINEFSTSTDLGGDQSRDTACPTQLAVKTYVDNQTGGGVKREKPLVAIQSLTSSGTTATLTSFVIHNVVDGDRVVISGADQGNYNGEFVVFGVSLDGKSFQYTMSGAAGALTGAVTCERLQRVKTGIEFEGNLELTPTWDESSTIFNAISVDITDTNSQGSSNILTASVDGVSKFAVDKDGNISAAGDLTIAGTTTTVNSTNLSIADTEIIIANGASTHALADGAGLQLGTTNLSFKWDDTNDRWNLPNAGLNIGASTSYQIGNEEVLNSTTLGTSITASSLESLGELSSLTVTGNSKIGSVNEAMAIISGGTTATTNYNSAAIMYMSSPSGQVTASVTNLPTTENRANSVVLAIQQGSTPYNVSNNFGVNGSSVSIKWANGGTTPDATATSGNVDTFNFTIINQGTSASPSWIVLGSVTNGFGGAV
jgi:hypothetical protein